MQNCNQCHESLPLTEFHKHPGFPLGVRKICKTCACAQSKDYYSKNREKHLNVCKEWQNKNKTRVSETKKRTRARRKEVKENNKSFQPEKFEAKRQLGYMVFKGEIQKPAFCQICGCTGEKIEGHHHDYSKPDDVIWVCKSCQEWLYKRYCSKHEVISVSSA